MRTDLFSKTPNVKSWKKPGLREVLLVVLCFTVFAAMGQADPRSSINRSVRRTQCRPNPYIIHTRTSYQWTQADPVGDGIEEIYNELGAVQLPDIADLALEYTHCVLKNMFPRTGYRGEFLASFAISALAAGAFLVLTGIDRVQRLVDLEIYRKAAFIGVGHATCFIGFPMIFGEYEAVSFAGTVSHSLTSSFFQAPFEIAALWTPILANSRIEFVGSLVQISVAAFHVAYLATCLVIAYAVTIVFTFTAAQTLVLMVKSCIWPLAVATHLYHSESRRIKLFADSWQTIMCWNIGSILLLKVILIIATDNGLSSAKPALYLCILLPAIYLIRKFHPYARVLFSPADSVKPPGIERLGCNKVHLAIK